MSGFSYHADMTEIMWEVRKWLTDNTYFANYVRESLRWTRDKPQPRHAPWGSFSGFSKKDRRSRGDATQATAKATNASKYNVRYRSHGKMFRRSMCRVCPGSERWNSGGAAVFGS